MVGLMMIGFLCKKKDIIHRESKKDISNLLLYVSLPAATVNAFNRQVSQDLLQNGAVIILFGFAAHILAMMISKVLFHKEKQGAKEVMSYVAVFSNCAFMGFPVMQSLFGEEGIFYASLYLLSFNLFIWTYGQILFTRKTDRTALRKAFFNTGTLSVLTGVILLMSPVKLPEVMSGIISMLGSLTTPLAMIVIGATLAEGSISSLFKGYQMYYATFIRLIFMPVLWIILLRIIKMEPVLVTMCVLMVAMPAASNTAMFAEKFESDTLLASKTVVFSTMVSMLTIPVIVNYVS